MNFPIIFPVTMRTSPSLIATSGTGYFRFYYNGTNVQFPTFGTDIVSPTTFFLNYTSLSGLSAGLAGNISAWNAASYVGFSAEL